MLRNTVWVSVCLVVVLMFVAGCGDEDSPEHPSPAIMLTSAGGRASLAIPAGALPPGVSAAAIRITELAPADLPQDRNGSPVLGGVRLEPDGLVFNQPVTLTLTVPTSSIAVPVLLLFNAQSVEVVPDIQIEAKPGEGLLTLSAEIAHFTVVAAGAAFFSVALDEPGEEGVFGVHLVKETFDVLGEIFRTGKGKTLDFNYIVDFVPPDLPVAVRASLRLRPDAPWELTGLFFTSGPVTPAGFILNRPPLTTINNDNDSVSLIQPLTCESDGSYSVSYQAIISYDVELTTEFAVPLIGFLKVVRTEVIRLTTDLKVSGAGGSCFSPPPMPPPVTPPPPAPSRPPMVTLLQATLRVPVTTYSVTATDPDGGQLSYEWRMTGEACGTPRVPWTQTGATVQWSHADNPPDLCRHTGTNHDVLTSVTITTSRGVSVQCVISGSETLAIPDPKCL